MPTHFPEAMLAAQADRAACRDLLRQGSRTFFAASHLLPRAVREPATALYAFCRLADDAVDLQPSKLQPSKLQAGRTATVARLRERLDRAYAGRPLPLAADRAFAETVARYAIPRALPEALLEGLAWDAAGRHYETLSDLHAYAARVAGSVGAMMAVVMGATQAEAVGRACDLGAAMQLTNIARDVGEDAREGRLYLPRSWMREDGIDPDAWLAAPRFTPEIGHVVARLLREADRLYAASEPGIAALPTGCRPGIRAARLLYGEIGAAVVRQGCDSVSRRASVPARRKARLLLRALVTRSHAVCSQPHVAALAEARFLVQAVESGVRKPARASGVEERMIWVIELFERVERRRQALG